MAKAKSPPPLLLLIIGIIQIVGIGVLALLFVSISDAFEGEGINYPLWVGLGFLVFAILPLLAIKLRRSRPYLAIILLTVFPMISMIASFIGTD